MSSASMYGRALSLLRQVSVVLNEQLVDVDLFALRRDTVGNMTSAQLTGGGGSGSMAESTATMWRDVLAAVSPPLVEFGRELARVQQYIEEQRASVLSMQRVIWAMEAMTVIMAYMTLSSLLRRSQTDNDVGGGAVGVGVIVAVSLFMLAMFGSWNASVNEMYRKVNFQANSPLQAVLVTYARSLSGKMIVVMMAAVVTGRNVGGELKQFQDSNTRFNSAWASATATCGKKTAGSAPDCNVAGLDPCDTASYYTLTSMVHTIKGYCTYLLVDIVDGLIDLKELGVDRYEEATLWRAVNLGVDAVRRLAMTEYDAGGPTTFLTASAVRHAVEYEVAPVLCLPGVELRGQIVPVGSPLTAVSDGKLTLLNGDDDARPMSQAQCTRSCIASPSQCVFAYYNDNGMCYTASDVKNVVSGFEPATTANKALAGTGTFTRPNAYTVPADASPITKFVDIVESAGLYAYAASQPGAVAATVRGQSTDLAERVTAVLKRYRYRINLDDARALLDGRLSKYYGPGLYREGGVSAAIDGILDRVRRLVAERRRTPTQRFVDANRLREKVAALSSDEADDLLVNLQNARDAAASHRNLYPAYQATAPQRIANIVSVLGGLVFLTCYVVYAVVLWDMFTGHKVISFEALIQRLIAGTSVFVIVTYVTETIAIKKAYRMQHNWQTSIDNGQMLVQSAANVYTQLGALIPLIARAPGGGAGGTSGSTATATATATVTPTATATPTAGSDGGGAQIRSACAIALSGCVELVSKYDACNSITAGQAAMPLPMAEIVLYGIVAATFMGLAAVVVYRVAPFERVDNIRSLIRLRHRLERGDHGAFVEAQQVVECSKPPLYVWSMFAWFAVLMFAALTGWFSMASQDVVADYKRSLDASDDCRG